MCDAVVVVVIFSHGFSAWYVCLCVCVYVCMSALINNQYILFYGSYEVTPSVRHDCYLILIIIKKKKEKKKKRMNIIIYHKKYWLLLSYLCPINENV